MHSPVPNSYPFLLLYTVSRDRKYLIIFCHSFLFEKHLRQYYNYIIKLVADRKENTMYINRAIENTILKTAKGFKSVLITGPRQVGKFTMLKRLFSDRKYIRVISRKGWYHWVIGPFSQRDHGGWLRSAFYSVRRIHWRTREILSAVRQNLGQDDMIYPVEIKLSANPKLSMTNAFDVLDHIPEKKRGIGVIICMYNSPLWLKENIVALPVEYI